MSDSALIALAEHAGIAPRWRDAFDTVRHVSAASLRLVLEALGIPAQTDRAVRDSLAMLAQPPTTGLPPLITVAAGAETTLPAAAAAYRLTLEDGTIVTGRTTPAGPHSTLPAIALPGYHELLLGDQRTTLAVAPPRCFSIRDAEPRGRLWGLAAQLYALRRPGDGGIGDFAALRQFVTQAAKAGAAAVAISPVHAQFSADPYRFSPYGPSSRIQLNVLHADVDDLLAGEPDDPDQRRLEALPLIDWPAASLARLARFRRAYAKFLGAPPGPLHAAFATFQGEGGEALAAHATFEALHGHFYGADPGLWHWHSWPVGYRNPNSPDVAAFARDHATEIGFHAFLQFLADRGLASAQHAARAAGMAIGLISDLAVGTDSGGSHAWSRQGETLLGLAVGAPPDILSSTGQDWGLAAFSPTGLQRHGYSAYLEMLRAALRHAGGVRIDHVMGLARLWVLPHGAQASEGAYLRFPMQDLLRLIALESQRHRAIILGEDLGTLPDGFQQALDEHGLMGLRVLWFEHDGQRFRPPGEWTRDAAAMTSTHDLATVNGWWSGHDLDTRRALHQLGDDTGVYYAYQNRARDRPDLWTALRNSGAASGEPPAQDDPIPVVDAAIRHIGGSNCDLALLPIEDAMASPDQPNLPGTTDQHPNWRRRLAFTADTLFADAAISARLRTLDEARQPPES